MSDWALGYSVIGGFLNREPDRTISALVALRSSLSHMRYWRARYTVILLQRLGCASVSASN